MRAALPRKFFLSSFFFLKRKEKSTDVQCIPLAKKQFFKKALLPEYSQHCMLAKEVIIYFLFSCYVQNCFEFTETSFLDVSSYCKING